MIESTGIKYTSITTRSLGVSGRLFLEALIAGERNPASLADLAKGRLRVKTEQHRAAFGESSTTHHGNLTRLHLDRIDLLNAHIQTLTGLIGVLINEHSLGWARDLLATIPGIGETGAENILAETGLDMACFDTPAHLAPWAGVRPGQHESAGKSRQVRARPGNAHLKGALGIAAMAAARTNWSFFQHRYTRTATRDSPPAAGHPAHS